MKTISIFISSPGDVEEERNKARLVVAALQAECGSAVSLLPVLWEDLAIPATASFQEGIDFVLSQRHRIDIAVFILWSRLGSPLGAAVTKRDGSPYLSGTEREFDLMLSAFEQSGRKIPVLLAYTRDDLEGFNERLDARTHDDTKLEELLQQRRLVKQFIRERFHDEEGRNLRAYHSYREPVNFAQRLHGHLRDVLDELLGLEHGAITWHEAPYRSLEVFDVRHAPIFCGRDEEICDLTQRLREQHQAGCAFAVIVGASGSGKSSLARAGVAATLMQRSFDDGIQEWRAVIYLPGHGRGELFPALARALAEALPELREGVGGLEKFAAFLGEGKFDAAEILLATAVRAAEAKLRGRLRLLLVLDQMEELWTERTLTEAAREAFLGAVDFLARSGAVSVLATLRSDFYAQAQLCPAFLRMKGGRGHFDLIPPGPAALQALITRPAQRANWRFEHDLSAGRSLDQKILEDAARDPSALPLLQYALAELHERCAARRPDGAAHRELLFSVYDEMGGVEGALGQRAQQTFAGLSRAGQDALPGILPRLISIDMAGEQNAVRVRAPLAEVTQAPGARELVDALVKARFLTTDQEDHVSIVTLAHEALLRRWERVAEWLNANRNHLLARARVQHSQRRWEESARNPSLLLPEGLALEEGRALLQEAPGLLTGDTRAYIGESISAAENRRRKLQRDRRRVLGALTSLLLLSLLAASWAWVKQREAEVQTTRAVQSEADTRHQLDRAFLGEGRAWLERGRNAGNHFLGIMLAGRAIGFREYGWREEDRERFGKNFPPLLSQPFQDAELEQERLAELAEVHEFIARQSPTAQLLWSSPFTAHTGEVTSVAFSPDGTRLVSGSEDKTVKLWDVATGKELATLDGHAEGVTSVAFSADGTRLVSGSKDKTAKLWDAATGKEFATLKGHKAEVTCVAISPDGTCIASGSNDKTVKVWETATGKELATLDGHKGEVTGLAFSPDGRRLACAAGNYEIKLWEVTTGKQVASLDAFLADLDLYFYCVAFSPDGTRIVSGTSEGRLVVWDAAKGRYLYTLEGDSPYMTSVAFSTDGTRIVAGTDWTVELWDAVTGEGITMLADEYSGLGGSAAFSPDGTRIASASRDKIAKLWDAAASNQLAILAGPKGEDTALAFSPDSIRIASGTYDRTVKLWDTATGNELATLSGHKGSVTSVAFSADGSRLVSGSRDKTVKIWDAATGRELATLAGHQREVMGVTFNADGTRMASESLSAKAGNKTGEVKLWDAATGKEVAPLAGSDGNVSNVLFSPDGTRLASVSVDRTIKLWDAATGQALASLAGHQSDISKIVFSPDGTRLASASWDRTVKVWDAATGQELVTFTGHSSSVTQIAFSPDSRRIASASSKSVLLWDAATGRELPGKPDFPFSTDERPVSPDGKVRAIHEKNWIRLESTATFRPDLMHSQRQNLIALKDRNLDVRDRPSSASPDSFTPPFVRQDELSELARGNPSESRRQHLRLQLLAKGRQWRAALAAWPAMEKPDAESRRVFLTLLLSQILADSSRENAPSIPLLLPAITQTLDTSTAADTRVLLPLVQVLKSLPVSTHFDPQKPAVEALLKAALATLPVQGRATVLVQAAGKKWSEETQQFILHTLVELALSQPADAAIQRGCLAALPFEDTAWKPAVERVLALPDAMAKDFIDAAYKAVQSANGEETSKTLLKRARARFPDEPDVLFMAGRCSLKLGRPAEAYVAFQSAEKLIREGKKPSTSFLRCLVIARWLVNDQTGAVADCLRLIETGRNAKPPENWTDPTTIQKQNWPETEKKPLREALEETLRLHPELKTAPPAKL